LEELLNMDVITPILTTLPGNPFLGVGSPMIAAITDVEDLSPGDYFYSENCPDIPVEETVKGSSWGGGGFSKAGNGFGIDKNIVEGGEDYDSSLTINTTFTEA